MASREDLVAIINQLLIAMDKMGESLAVVKEIKEDVKALAEEVKEIKIDFVKNRDGARNAVLPESDLSPITKPLQEKLELMEEMISNLRINEIAEDCGENTRRGLDNIEHRMDNFKETLKNNTETLANIKDTLTNFEATLKIIEGNMIPLVENLCAKKDSDSEDIATNEPSTHNTNEKVQMTFDPKFTGRNVQLSNDLKTATRTNPREGDGYGGVVSFSPLIEDRIFEIKIEETIDQWRGWGMSIGVLMEEKKGEEIRGAVYICWDLKGSWGIQSWRDSNSGKSHTHKDGYIITPSGYPLDTRDLPVGTRLGVSRHHNGDLHFYLNGVDKGKAFSGVPKNVYAFVDVIHYATKITIVN